VKDKEIFLMLCIKKISRFIRLDELFADFYKFIGQNVILATPFFCQSGKGFIGVQQLAIIDNC
jgi:hypothetical protein